MALPRSLFLKKLKLKVEYQVFRPSDLNDFETLTEDAHRNAFITLPVHAV
jgi:hypothetical protein